MLGNDERPFSLVTYLFHVSHPRSEAIAVLDLRCCAAMEVQARKGSGRLFLFSIPGSIVPFIENVLLNPVDDANTP